MDETVRPLLERHLQSILDCDVDAYHATTGADLSLYEWYETRRAQGDPVLRTT